MPTEEEKLEAFVAAVGSLYPKAEVSNPMNSRHADMYYAFDEGMKFTKSKSDVTKKVKITEAVRTFHHKVYSHFYKNNRIFVYAEKADNSKMKFRSKPNKGLTEDIYYEQMGCFHSAKLAIATLEKYVQHVV